MATAHCKTFSDNCGSSWTQRAPSLCHCLVHDNCKSLLIHNLFKKLTRGDPDLFKQIGQVMTEQNSLQPFAKSDPWTVWETHVIDHMETCSRTSRQPRQSFHASLWKYAMGEPSDYPRCWVTGSAKAFFRVLVTSHLMTEPHCKPSNRDSCPLSTSQRLTYKDCSWGSKFQSLAYRSSTLRKRRPCFMSYKAIPYNAKLDMTPIYTA